MNLNYNFFKIDDGQSLAYKVWDKVEVPTGVVIIIHGMAEHIERYDSFAQHLNENGLIVYGTDQRGHGKTSGKKGLFTYDKGWGRVIKDQVDFFHFVQNRHVELEISYVAHSMGSYIARVILANENLPIKKIILSGTSYETKTTTIPAILMSQIITKVKGPGKEAVFLDSLLNEPLANSIHNPVTTFDWLSRDQVEVAKYINDSNCGFICSNQFFKDFFAIISISCKKSGMNKIDKELPILLYSGEKDPVGGKDAKNVKTLYSIYKKLGLNVQLIINPGGRHESLNETNRADVYKDFTDFLLK